MTRIGPRELQKLRVLAGAVAQIVPSPRTKSLVRKGLLDAEPDGSFARITPAGLRALADAAEAGRIKLFDMGALRERGARANSDGEKG